MMLSPMMTLSPMRMLGQLMMDPEYGVIMNWQTSQVEDPMMGPVHLSRNRLMATSVECRTSL